MVESKTAKKKPSKLYSQKLFLDWCKSCGICIAFCPKKVFQAGDDGKPRIINAAQCIGCRFCELHCPDFVISIEEVQKPKGSNSNDQ